MPKVLTAAMILAKNQLEQPAVRWLELWQIEISPGTLTRYLTNHTTAVVYQGFTYEQFPIRHEGIKEEAHGKIQRITVHVANVSRELQHYLEIHDGLRGRYVTLILVNQGDLTMGDLRQTFIIEGVTADDLVVSFILGKPIPVLDVRLPGRLITRDLFPSLPQV